MAMAAPSHGGLKVTALNGVKVYTVSGQRSFPSWVLPAKLKALRKDDEYMRRIELIQDMTFTAAATHIKSTPDGEYIIASGIFPPQVRVYELREMSLKFERHLDAEIVDFQVLGDDYSKLAFLCTDRSVCLHAKYGSHYQIRIPRMGRDLAYDRWSCDLVVAASSPELYRINLEQGRFLAPLSTRSPAINVVGRSPVHGLIACGGEDGALECFDLRQKSAVGRIDAVGPTGNGDQEVTSVRFDETEGLLVALGTSSGQVLLYDIRSSVPVYIKDHMYSSPIVDIKWHESLSTAKRHIISADHRVVRIWDPETGDSMTNVEPAAGEINDICVIRNSGLMFMALDSPQIPSYFIPSLGPAPKWCSYLENLTEEMEEEGQSTIYDDYKFVTREDLDKLNLTNLIGTNLLHAYMHGFFMDHRLYHKARAMADPFAYESYRQKRIQEKLDAERAARITIKRKLPKVNKKLAARLLAAASEDMDGGNQDFFSAKENDKKRRKTGGADLLKDERFAGMFVDEAFEVDEESREYKALHPNAEKNKAALVQEHFDLVNESYSDHSSDRDRSSESSSSEDETSVKKRRKSNVQKKDGGISTDSLPSRPRLYEVKDEAHAQAFRNRVSLAAERALPLEDRISVAEKENKQNGFGGITNRNRGKGGGRELSFVSRSQHKSDFKGLDRKKRSVKSLGLKGDRPNLGGRVKGRHGFGRGRRH